MARLDELIQRIPSDNTWGIWAEVPFTTESEARLVQFEPEWGRLLDDEKEDGKVFFATGTYCGHFIAKFCDGQEEDNQSQSQEDLLQEAIKHLIEDVEQERYTNERAWENN